MLPLCAGRAAARGAALAISRAQPSMLHRGIVHLASLRTTAAMPRPAPLAARPPLLQQLHRRSITCRSYASPEVYDIAFSFRDFEAEVAFLLDAYQLHCGGQLTRFLDVGCGPARHATLLASAAGVQSLGLDSSPEMLAYAAQRAQRAGVAAGVALVQGDMAAERGFAHLLPGGQVDVAAVMLGTLSHCLDNAAALRCLRNLAEAVRPGGLLVLELPHPDELFDGTLLSPDQFVDCWDAAEGEDGGGSVLLSMGADLASDDEGDGGDGGEASGAPPAPRDEAEAIVAEDEESEEEEGASGRGSGRRVLVEYGREGDAFDPGTQVLRRTVGLSLFDPDGNLISSDVEVVPQRQFGLQEVDLLARAAGFTVAGVNGDVALDVPLDAEGAYRMVVCLKKN